MKTWILILILITTTFTFAQPPETLWTRTYGWNWGCYGNSVKQTSDSGFIIAGYHGNDWYLVKTDENGDTLWTQTYGENFRDKCYDVEINADGGYILTGQWDDRESSPDSSDCCLVKTDSLGNIQWTRTYQSASLNLAYDVERTNDGGYIFVGYTHDGGQIITYDWYIVKTDSIGDTLWTRSFGNSWNDQAYSVDQTNDGGYIVAGWGGAIGSDSFVYLVKLSASGSTQWEQYFMEGKARAVEQIPDGGYMLVGSGSNPYNPFLIITDSIGNEIWTRGYGGEITGSGYAARQTADGGYIIAGGTSSIGMGESDYYVIRTDTVGEVLWYQTYGGFDSDYGRALDLTDDGGYIVAGNSHSFGGSTVMYVVRIGPDQPSITPSAETSIIPNSLTLHPPYPNPFNASTTISYDVSSVGRVHISIYNLLGQKIASIMNEYVSPGSYSAIWNAGDRPSGIYLCRMEMDNFHQVRKIVLLK